jgi:hypothetical protein
MLNRPMTILATGKSQREFRLSREQYARLMTVPGFAPATLAQTMGPNWRHIFWLTVVTNNKPGKARPAVVCSERLTLADVFRLIGYGEG